MTLASNSIDPEIAEAYGSAPTSTAPAANAASYDPEISEAFKDTGKKDDKKGFSLFDKARNVYGSFVEPAVTMATGAIAKPVSDIAGLAATGYDLATGNKDGDPAGFRKDVQDRLTYEPRTEAGRQTVDFLGKASDMTVGNASRAAGGIAGGAYRLAGFPDSVSDAVDRGTTEAITQIPNFLGAKKIAGNPVIDVPKTAQAAADAIAAKQAGGAAGTAVDVSKLLPETQAELARLHAAGKDINPKALNNIAEAESLPVPVRHTAGAATEDTALKSEEFNSKGANPEIGKRFDENNQAMQDSLSTFHQEAAPTAVGNSEIQNGQGVIDSLKRYDQPKVQAINEAYQKAKDANGGDLPMDGNAFVTQAEANLKDSNRTRFLPSEVRGILDDIKAKNGDMSFDEFEANRTILAEQARKAERAGDGTAAKAISNVRDALESTPVSGGTAEAKALYDNARGLAKGRFQEMEQDPAYKSAVEDSTQQGELSPLADKFNEKYVLNGAKANLQQLRNKLDPEGHEAMTSSTYNYLKDKSGASKGTFNQNGYNTAVAKIRPKANELLGDPDRVEDIEKLGRVANREQFQSRGSYANNSHTLVGALAKDAIAGAGHFVPPVAKGAINLLGDAMRKRSAANALHETLKPGAGLSD